MRRRSSVLLPAVLALLAGAVPAAAQEPPPPEAVSTPAPEAVEPPVTETERQALPPKVVLSRDELGVIESFLRRRKLLSPERAEELAVLFGPRLSERTGVVAPTWERVLTLAYARATGKDR